MGFWGTNKLEARYQWKKFPKKSQHHVSLEEERGLRDVSPLGPSMIGINRLWIGGYHEPAVLSRRSTVLAEYRIQHQATSKAQHTVRQMKAETIIRVVAVLISSI